MTTFPQMIPFAAAVGAPSASGLLAWDGLGAAVMWIVFVTLASALIGILFDFVGGHSRPTPHPHSHSRRRGLRPLNHGA